MTDHEKSGRHPRTTPSEAVGEAGDREARQQADDAVVQRPGGDEADAGGHSAKKQRPGIGREEQARPADPRRTDGRDH
ncbi:hypothetical protein ACFWUZ_12065 [Streptomyces sp. NPDC058646]|uniref:hypothetical protein n=1 Tax=Streptomyces sp. NPDC058646 TaxID=3346574 RepID=UPI00364A44C6